jgi:sulfhydrogenase subunit delta
MSALTVRYFIMMKLKKIMTKPKVAIYDFTDCEGCEVKLVSLREKFLLLEKKVDIVNWRLGQERFEPGPYDLTIVEGTPITPEEVRLLKELRLNSKILMALGACAALGGIPAMMPEKDRKFWYEKIYTSQYHPRGIDAVPLSAIVPVDFTIHGCPVDEKEVLKVLEDILAGKKPIYRDYSVCLDCKVAGNRCRIAEENKPCLGPITQGGCGAICVSGGSPCYGCFGIREEANLPALEKILGKEEAEKYLAMFHKKTKL